MKKLVVMGLMGLFTVAGILLMAAVYHHPGTGVSIWFPDQWRVTRVGRALYAEAPDGRAMVQYIGLGVRDMRSARIDYRKFLEPQIRRVREIRQGRRFQLNNMTCAAIHAEGMIRRTPWDLKIYLIQAPGNIGMLVQRHMRGSMDRKIPFTNILESIKPYGPVKDHRRHRR